MMQQTKIKLRQEFYHGSGHSPFPPGSVLEVTKAQADELIAAGIADMAVEKPGAEGESAALPALKTAPEHGAETPEPSGTSTVTEPAKPSPEGATHAEPAADAGAEHHQA